MSYLFIIGLILTGIIVFVLSMVTYGTVEKRTAGNAKWVAEKLDLMFIALTAKTAYRILMMGPFLLGLMGFFALWPNIFLGILLGAALTLIGFVIPRPIIQGLLRQRTRKINVQMVDALTLMANALRSGLSLLQAIQVVVDEMPDPVSQEMNLILSEQRVGVPVEKAFQHFAERVESEDIEMFVTAVIVLRETGGNLAETFDTIVYTIRERLKLENKISALVTQGVMQGSIVTLIPFVLMILLSAIDPAHMAPLFNTIYGIIMLVIMLTFQTVGGLMIKKIVTIKI